MKQILPSLVFFITVFLAATASGQLPGFSREPAPALSAAPPILITSDAAADGQKLVALSAQVLFPAANDFGPDSPARGSLRPPTRWPGELPADSPSHRKTHSAGIETSNSPRIPSAFSKSAMAAFFGPVAKRAKGSDPLPRRSPPCARSRHGLRRTAANRSDWQLVGTGRTSQAHAEPRKQFSVRHAASDAACRRPRLDGRGGLEAGSSFAARLHRQGSRLKQPAATRPPSRTTSPLRAAYDRPRRRLSLPDRVPPQRPDEREPRT